MFIVKDCTRNPPYTMVSNDAKNVRDIVIGITGDEMHHHYRAPLSTSAPVWLFAWTRFQQTRNITNFFVYHRTASDQD